MDPEHKSPAATRIISKSEARVPVRIPPGFDDADHSELCAALQRSLSAIGERKLAGTKRLRFSDLLDYKAGLVVKAKAMRLSPPGVEIPDLVKWLKTTILPSTAKKGLVLAAPGEGKTTTSLLLLEKWNKWHMPI